MYLLFKNIHKVYSNFTPCNIVFNFRIRVLKVITWYEVIWGLWIYFLSRKGCHKNVFKKTVLAFDSFNLVDWGYNIKSRIMCEVDKKELQYWGINSPFSLLSS